jgi:DNA ligase-associated metallophosphoesterase
MPVQAQAAASGDLEIEVAGDRLRLLPERAAWWPAGRTLLVADVHFGKAASFRAQGVPVPGGTTAETLARLDALVNRLDAARIAFLGDFLHSRQGRVPGTLEALSAWRHRHAAIELLLVRGNHDVRAGDPPEALDVRVESGPFPAGPWLLCHEPGPQVGGYVLAGHIHPAVRLAGRANESLRLPCFWFGADSAVLPAFGAFTGTAVVEPRPGDRVCVIAGDRVLEVPARNRDRRPA